MANRQNRNRPSIAGGLIVVTVGIVFLIANLQPDLDFWSIAMRYWPVILIVIGLGKIFEIIKNDGLGDVLACVAGEVRELGRHPAEIAQHSACDCCSLRIGRVGKSDAQIEFGGLAQFWKQSVRKPRDGRAKRA